MKDKYKVLIVTVDGDELSDFPATSSSKATNYAEEVMKDGYVAINGVDEIKYVYVSKIYVQKV